MLERCHAASRAKLRVGFLCNLNVNNASEHRGVNLKWCQPGSGLAGSGMQGHKWALGAVCSLHSGASLASLVMSVSDIGLHHQQEDKVR